MISCLKRCCTTWLQNYRGPSSMRHFYLVQSSRRFFEHVQLSTKVQTQFTTSWWDTAAQLAATELDIYLGGDQKQNKKRSIIEAEIWFEIKANVLKPTKVIVRLLANCWHPETSSMGFLLARVRCEGGSSLPPRPWLGGWVKSDSGDINKSFCSDGLAARYIKWCIKMC